jgi:hypothetical protein
MHDESKIKVSLEISHSWISLISSEFNANGESRNDVYFLRCSSALISVGHSFVFPSSLCSWLCIKHSFPISSNRRLWFWCRVAFDDINCDFISILFTDIQDVSKRALQLS